MSNDTLKIIHDLQNVNKELDHRKVSWIDKHFVIDLKQKSEILLESITRLEDNEKDEALKSAKEFLTEVKPVILKINTGV